MLRFGKNNKPWAMLAVVAALLLSVFSFSYIHPDEHFQSIEILLWKWNPNAFGVTIPWEFAQGARSFAPLFLWYLPLYPIISSYQPAYNPLHLLVVFRVYNYLMYVGILAFVLKKNYCNNKKQKYYNTFILVFTSHITISYQTHTFSNGIETNLLLLAMYLIHKLLKSQKRNRLFSLALGTILAVGIFNRVTFASFLFLPLLKLAMNSSIPKNIQILIPAGFMFLLVSYVQIKVDTYFFKSDSLVVSPIVNLTYNVNSANLSIHGLHPRFTHFLVNIPQMLGPLTIPLISWRVLKLDIWVLSIIGGLSILSIFPHQELRFLIPLMPIFCIVLVSQRLRIPKILFKAWFLFNITMYVVMGVLHQAGNIMFFQQKDLAKSVESSVHIWWKTYSPPTWMYLQPDMSSATTSFCLNKQGLQQIEVFENYKKGFNEVIDLKGCDTELLEQVLHHYLFGKNTSCIVNMPSSVAYKLKDMNYKFSKVWETKYNLDMDHFDFSNPESFKLGMAAYMVEKL